MAAAVLRKTEIGAKEFGRYVDVPEVPKAKLMYYLDSICYALDLDKSEANIRKLRDYTNHRKLTDEESDELLLLCILFSPDVLINKCIFMDEDMCGEDLNKFYEITAVANRFVITEDILIAGERRTVKKILCFREIWMEFCYLEPIKHFQSRLAAIATQIRRRQGGGESAQPRAGQSRVQSSAPSRVQSSGPSRAAITGTVNTVTTRTASAAPSRTATAGPSRTPSSRAAPTTPTKDCVVL